jgi:hypothetical protein
METISSRDDCERVTILLRRYNTGAIVDSMLRPSAANDEGRAILHISACTWWRKTILGPWNHNGEKNGIPFHTSTTASALLAERMPSHATAGNTP